MHDKRKLVLNSSFITRKIERAWIGYNDISQEGKFSWIKGSGTYTNWKEGYPDGKEIENCAVIMMRETWNGKWNDVPCHFNYSSICEKPSKCIQVVLMFSL